MDGVVLVTGASTGIGRATALALDSRGFRVVAGVRRAEDAEQLGSLASDRLVPLNLDVTDPDQVADAVGVVRDTARSSRLVGIVNNAGIAVSGPIEFVPLDLWRQQFEVNVIGVVAITQAFLPMLRVSHGRVVIIGSLGGRLSQPMVGPYCASKHALEAISDSLRIELRPWGIGVSLIEPGAVATPIWEKGLRAGAQLVAQAPEELRRLYGNAVTAVSRMAVRENQTGVAPEKVADAVAHALLASSPRTRYRVGRDARLAIPLTRMLPDRLKDRLLIKVMGLPRTAREAEREADSLELPVPAAV